MIYLFWAGVLWLGYVYAGYLLLLGLVALVARIRPILRDDSSLTVSVLISARNEEKDIAWKVAETLAWDYPSDRLEVLVASDASEDRTVEVLAGIGDPRLRFFRLEPRGGKNRALNFLAREARGEILFFTDANAHIAPDCLRRMTSYFADPRAGCVTGITCSRPQPGGGAVGSGAGVYFGYESVLYALESRLGATLVCDGAIFCMRRSLFSPLLPELANDLELPLKVRAAGFWTLFEPLARVVETETSSPREEFARRRRICAQGALASWKLRKMLRGLLGWQFLSHKVLRWLTAIPLAMILLSTACLAAAPPFAVLLALQMCFYFAALLAWLLTLAGRSTGRLLSVPFCVVLGSAGALLGVAATCCGRRFAAWEIPTLSRGRAEKGAQP
jgi:cellulose synthase/poly-beta-1,6-N-acetylglucosamine synthase-like glycosyltransferase